jgi:hypothetical protein
MGLIDGNVDYIGWGSRLIRTLNVFILFGIFLVRLNSIIFKDVYIHQGELKHLDFKHSAVKTFTTAKDNNGIVWQSLTATHQKDKLNEM